jgi:MraZ protein
LFLGKYSRTLDSKGRFSLPSSFREQISDGAYITQGFDRNLQVITSRAFQEVYRKVMSLNVADPLARLLLRLILGTATRLGTESSNHLSIPGDLKDFANLKEDIFLIGQGDYFEIWSPTLWEEQQAKIGDAETNSTRFITLSVAMR